MFKKLKLGQKLIGGFLAVAALCAIVGLVGVFSLGRIWNGTEEITDNQLPSVMALGKLEAGIVNVRRAELALVVTNQVKGDADVYVKQYETALHDEVEASWRVYDSLPRTARGDSLWKAFQLRYKAYKDYLDTTIPALARGSVNVDRKWLASGLALYSAAVGPMNDLEAAKRQVALDNASAASATYSSSRTVVFSGIFVAVALAIVLGLLITRAIVSSVREVAERTERLRTVCIADLNKAITGMATGDLSFTPVASTQPIGSDARDEIGDMARTVDGMIAATKSTVEGFAKSQGIVRALVTETHRLTTAATAGQLSTRGDTVAFDGDFRAIVGGVNDTLDAVIRPVEEATQALERLAARDLTARVQGNYAGDHARIKNALNTAATNLDQAMAEVSVASEQVAAAGEQISSGSQALAQGASEQASAIEEVSSSLHEMASMAKQSAANAKEARGLSSGAKDGTQAGVERVQRLSAAMDRIKASSADTAKIVKTIDEIAFQTNLLALNAAVEAARAGDAGKGFAVVAEEVRNLAMRSAEAAKNTASLIEESVKNAEQGVEVSGEVEQSLVDIAQRVTKVTEVMEEVAAASEQQTQGIAQINTAVDQMNSVTQQVAANSEESASSSEELSSQAEHMRSMVGTFQISGGDSHGARPAARPRQQQRRETPRAAARPAAAAARKPASPSSRLTPAQAEALIPMHDDGDDDTLAEF